MKRLEIDFTIGARWRLPVVRRRRQILLLAAGLLALGAVIVGWHWQQLGQQLVMTRQAMASARNELAAQTPPPPTPLLLSALQVTAINRAIAQLNTPWPSLLDGFERAATREVALLAIEPDPRRGRVKGVAEAKSHQQMLDYLDTLGRTAPFADALLVQQELNDRDPYRPLRFTFEVLLVHPASAATSGEHE